MPSGKLEKMTIMAFAKPNFTQQVGSTFTVMINPEKYSHNHSISYNRQTGQGAAGTPIKFEKVDPEKVSFELVFDGTGVVPGTVGADGSSAVQTQIDQFKTLAYTYNGSIHSTNYLKLSWGTLLFKCRLTSLEVSYTLFKPDGTPLRAKATANFEEYTDAQTIALEANQQSPDITHIVTVLAGDTLPLMCYRIYGNASYYQVVAKKNNIVNYRNLKPGTQIVFPPLK